MVISGTGSIAYGRTADGRTAKAGGMDYLLADQGSGYAIGLATLQAAVKSFDGRSEKSLLESLVCEHFATTSIETIKTQVYNPVLTKIEVAEFAQLCFTAHNSGDEVASQILARATDELLELAVAVTKRLELHNKNTPVVLAGAVLRQEPIKSGVSQRLETEFSHKILYPENPPVFGAVNLAVQYFHEK